MARRYFDHNATTPLDPRVAAAMRPWLGDRFGNPSSVHSFGRAAREAVEAARQAVAGLLGGAASDVVFTASGTEANNTVLAGVGRLSSFRGRLVVSALEHPSVRVAAHDLAGLGMEVVRVDPEPSGTIAAERLLAEVDRDTRLVCLMLANNEIGTLQPVARVAARCRELGVPVLCDAVQAVGKIAVDVSELGVDFLTLGAHKLHGPLGAAALWLRPEAPFAPLLVGGSQERRRRASTVNVPAVVGLGSAAGLAAAELAARGAHLAALRDRFEAGIAARRPGVVVHGAAAARLPNTSNIALPGIGAEALVVRLDLRGFAVSSGSACSSGAVEPSATLLAMGLSAPEIASSFRVSFGMTNTAEEVDALVAAVAEEAAALEAAASGSRRRAAAP